VSIDTEPPPALLTIRERRIVERALGKNIRGAIDPAWTVDSLLDQIEADIGGATEATLENITEIEGLSRQYVRRVKQLRLHPQYGLPLLYSAETPGISDVWLEIHVDSFVVLHKNSRPR